MSRRFHVAKVKAGFVSVDSAQLHHAQNVLRLPDGESVELFDDDGRTATGRLAGEGVQVDAIIEYKVAIASLIVAAAVPKGDRADWMVEKLSELGVDVFIPLACERSVVLPEGQGKSLGKRSRWERIAIEAAKQSRRAGVMRIGTLSRPFAATFHPHGTDAWYLSTASNSVPIVDAIARSASTAMLVYIGPEGGWTERECAAFDEAGVTAVKLTDTILRVETAAITVAAVLSTRGVSGSEREGS